MHILNTAVLIKGKQDPWEIYNAALTQALFYEGASRKPSDIEYATYSDEGGEYISTSTEEDLPIIIVVYYRPGGEVFTEEEAKASKETSCGKPECETHRRVPCHSIIGMASSINYHDTRGWNAGNLHSGMIWSVGGFLDGKQVPWQWQENVSYLPHDGYKELESLPETVEKLKRSALLEGRLTVLSREALRRMGLLRPEE